MRIWIRKIYEFWKILCLDPTLIFYFRWTKNSCIHRSVPVHLLRFYLNLPSCIIGFDRISGFLTTWYTTGFPADVSCVRPDAGCKKGRIIRNSQLCEASPVLKKLENILKQRRSEFCLINKRQIQIEHGANYAKLVPGCGPITPIESSPTFRSH